jgi:protein SCO1/2
LAITGFLLLNPAGARESQGDIGVYERLGQKVPLNLTFHDEKGSAVRLGDLINKPTILTLIYYHCDHICPQMLFGLAEASSRLEMTPGKDYGMITISFDEGDTSEDARDKKINYLKAANRPVPSNAWKFLTGDSENISKIADAVGVSFKRKGHGFIHPEVLIFLSPHGKITRYIYVSKYSYGLSYPVTFLPVDITSAIIDASKGVTAVGERRAALLCFPHEPEQQAEFFRILEVSGGVTLLLLGGFFFYLRTTDKKTSKGKNDRQGK